jgi:prepilin-type processing-associated H-X9-DG protein
LPHGIIDYAVYIDVMIQSATNQPSALRVAGLSQTVLAVDACYLCKQPDAYIGTWRLQRVWYTNPLADPCSREGPRPRHGNQLNVLFCDGSMQTMTYNQLLELLHAKAFEID